jgi:hypothetical protein
MAADPGSRAELGGTIVVYGPALEGSRGMIGIPNVNRHAVICLGVRLLRSFR